MISKKKATDSFLQTLLVLAVLHFGILVIHTVGAGDISNLNMFGILQIDLLYPFDVESTQSLVLSTVAISAVYIYIYMYRSS